MNSSNILSYICNLPCLKFFYSLINFTLWYICMSLLSTFSPFFFIHLQSSEYMFCSRFLYSVTNDYFWYFAIYINYPTSYINSLTPSQHIVITKLIIADKTWSFCIKPFTPADVRGAYFNMRHEMTRRQHLVCRLNEIFQYFKSRIYSPTGICKTDSYTCMLMII